MDSDKTETGTLKKSEADPLAKAKKEIEAVDVKQAADILSSWIKDKS